MKSEHIQNCISISDISDVNDFIIPPMTNVYMTVVNYNGVILRNKTHSSIVIVNN